MKWYIVQGHAGAEKKVSEQIKEELEKQILAQNLVKF
jgi:transcription antitermination factor NusG